MEEKAREELEHATENEVVNETEYATENEIENETENDGTQEAEYQEMLPFDVMMLRYSELDGIIRELGYDGAIRMGGKGSMPRYSIYRKDYTNPQEISIFLRETIFAGSAYLAMVTRIPFGEHSTDEIYDILIDVTDEAGMTAFTVNRESKEMILKSGLAIGGELLEKTQIQRFLEKHQADEKLVMERLG